MIQVEIVEYQLDSFLSPPLELVRTVRPRWIRIRISRRRDHPRLRRVAVENHVAEWRCNRNGGAMLKRCFKPAIKLSFFYQQFSRIISFTSIKFWIVLVYSYILYIGVLLQILIYFQTEKERERERVVNFVRINRRLFAGAWRRVSSIYIYIASRRHRLEEGKKEIFFFLIYRARNYRRYSLTNIDCFEATLAILINWPGVNYRIQRVLIYCPSGSLRCLRN